MTETKRNEDGATPSRVLTPREERLLECYHDGECGFVRRYIAERLMKENVAARGYIESLERVRRVSVARGACSGEIDLWSKVAVRIAQEEHAAVFLGERRESWGERLVGFVREHRHVAWGIPSGAALAGVLLLFISPVGESPERGMSEVARNSTTPPVVNLASTDVGRPVGRFREPVEVDWVRGSGRVRVMQDAHRNSAIIWVRRPQSPRFLPGERFDSPTPRSGTPRAFR